MKSAVLARPNLKFFVISALFMIVLQHMVTNGLFQGQASAGLMTAYGREATDAELQTWLQQAREAPDPAVYLQISRVYEQRGDFKRALQYLRRAEKLGLSEEGAE